MRCLHTGGRGGTSSPGHPGIWGVLYRELDLSWTEDPLQRPVASLCPADYCNSGAQKLEFPSKSHAGEEEVWGLVSARRGSLERNFIHSCQLVRAVVQEGLGQFSVTDEWDQI